MALGPLAQMTLEQLERLIKERFPLLSRVHTEQGLVNFVRQRLGLPENLQARLAAVPRSGTATAEWGGGSDVSATTTVEHGLRREPKIQLTPVKTSGGAPPTSAPAVIDGTVDETSFDFALRTVDGSTPANGIETLVYWQVS